MENVDNVLVDESEIGESPETNPSPRRKKPWLWIAIGAGLVVALAAAAFIGGQLLNKPVAGNVSETTINGPGGATTYKESSINMEKAEELPRTRPEAMGMFNRVEDNSIYIDTLTADAIKQLTSGFASSDMFEQLGPELEVVVTKDTQVYRDVTNPQYESEEGQVVQQKLETISVDEIKSAGMLIVWGRKQGDRMIADVVLVNGG